MNSSLEILATKQTYSYLSITQAGQETAFFLTSFESHSQVLCCPLMHYTYSYCQRIFDRENSICSKKAHQFWTNDYYFSHFYNEANHETFDFFNKVGGDADAKIDRQTIRRIFDRIVLSEKLIDRKKLIFATFFAYAKGTKKDLSDLRYLLLSDSISLPQEFLFDGFSGRILDDACADFPFFYCIHLVRDPRAGFASSNHQFLNEAGNMYGISPSNAGHVIKNIIQGNLSLGNRQNFIFGFWLAYFRQTFLAIERKKDQYSKHFILVKNEDLNLEFTSTLQNLCKKLSLTFNKLWDESPFVPTMLGKPWKGTGAYNNRYQRNYNGPLANETEDISNRLTGPNRYVTQRWKSRLSKSEKKVLDYFLCEEIQCYEYQFQAKTPDTEEFSSYRLEMLKPLRGELPCPTWIFNHKKGFSEVFNRVFYYLVSLSVISFPEHSFY